MYAIINTGGKQYRVEKGDIIDVELLGTEAGNSVEFKDVLLVKDGTMTKVGAPRLDHFIVRGEMLAEVKGPKVIAFKYKKRKSYHRKVGHRQRYVRVKITEITG
ncbi:MAG: 50S ribosomal protein L21 [Parachlamydiales bacterium]|nr:50S ribosomal protein L21 [Parachlamydiales bacterium]